MQVEGSGVKQPRAHLSDQPRVIKAFGHVEAAEAEPWRDMAACLPAAFIHCWALSTVAVVNFWRNTEGTTDIQQSSLETGFTLSDTYSAVQISVVKGLVNPAH